MKPCLLPRRTIARAYETSNLLRKDSTNSRSQFRMSSSKSPFELASKHGDFNKIQASRPDFDSTLPIEITKSPNPTWKYGQSASNLETKHKDHLEIDPYEETRPMISNYKLLVSGVPRPISFVSTLSKTGAKNLAPFSYFQVIDHDPPTFIIGFSARPSRPKDTQRNLEETGECVINIVSEHFLEAVNGTSLDIPYKTSEWELSGLTPAPSTTVKPSRVKESIFSIEGKLLEMKSLDYGNHAAEGKPTGSLAIIQATRFWVREDALSSERDDVDLSVLRPLVQLGGIQYGRVREVFERPRPSLGVELANAENGLRAFIGEGGRGK